MSRKIQNSSRNSSNVKPLKATPRAASPVRNTPVPKPHPRSQQPVAITYDMIAQRAYEIWQSGRGGSDFDNWVRAERELRSM